MEDEKVTNQKLQELNDQIKQIKHDPEYDFHLPTEAELFEQLRIELEKLNLSPFKRVFEESVIDEPTVAILGYIDYNLSVFMEAAKVSPGNFILCLEPEWFTLPSQEHLGCTHHLLAHKGIYFDSSLQCIFVEYKHPRTVDYFINYYSASGWPKQAQEEGSVVQKSLQLEDHFEGPMSNSAWLAKDINDKLLTRLLLREHGVAVPDFFAFQVKDLTPNKVLELTKYVQDGTITILPAEDEKRASIIRSKFAEFKKKYPQYDEVVVKPSGDRFCGGEGVKFFRCDQDEELVQHCLNLIHNYSMGDDDAVLLDSRVKTPPLWEDGVKTDYNLRVFAARTPADVGEVTGCIARAGKWGVTTNIAQGAHWATYGEIVRGLKLSQKDSDELWQRIVDMGPRTFEAMKKHEAQRKQDEHEPHRAQTDFVGLDVMLEMRDGVIVPVVIEVNDHEAAGQTICDQLYPEKRGSTVHIWLETMLKRATEHHKGEKPPVRDYKRISVPAKHPNPKYGAHRFQHPKVQHHPKYGRVHNLLPNTPTKCNVHSGSKQEPKDRSV